MRLCVGVAEFFHQRFLDLLDQLIGEIAVRGGVLAICGVNVLNPVIDIVGKSFLLLLLRDITLFEHILKDDLALLRICLLPGDRV